MNALLGLLITVGLLLASPTRAQLTQSVNFGLRITDDTSPHACPYNPGRWCGSFWAKEEGTYELSENGGSTFSYQGHAAVGSITYYSDSAAQTQSEYNQDVQIANALDGNYWVSSLIGGGEPAGWSSSSSNWLSLSYVGEGTGGQKFWTVDFGNTGGGGGGTGGTTIENFGQGTVLSTYSEAKKYLSALKVSTHTNAMGRAQFQSLGIELGEDGRDLWGQEGVDAMGTIFAGLWDLTRATHSIAGGLTGNPGSASNAFKLIYDNQSKLRTALDLVANSMADIAASGTQQALDELTRELPDALDYASEIYLGWEAWDDQLTASGGGWSNGLDTYPPLGNESFRDAELMSDGRSAVLSGWNQVTPFASSNPFPDSLQAEVVRLQGEGSIIKDVSLDPDGSGWVVVHGYNDYTYESLNSEAIDSLATAQSWNQPIHQFNYVSSDTSGDSFLILAGRSGYAASGVPSGLLSKIQEWSSSAYGYKFNSVSFDTEGNWMLVAQDGGAWWHSAGVPADLQTDMGYAHSNGYAMRGPKFFPNGVYVKRVGTSPEPSPQPDPSAYEPQATHGVWQPTGWVYFSWPYVWQDSQWRYFSSGGTRYLADLTNSQWGDLSSRSGWCYINGTYLYAGNTSRWYYFSQNNEQWVANLGNGVWETFLH